MTKKTALVCVSILFLWLPTLGVSFTENNVELTIRVPHDYQTIQEAINAANPGDEILVASGIYDEDILVNKSVSIIGEDLNGTVINGMDGRILTEIPYSVFNVIVDHVLIKNFTIINASYAVLVDSTFDVSIQNNIFMSNVFGIFLANSSSSLISSNTFLDNWGGVPDLGYGQGILLAGSSNITISENFLSQNLGGIEVEARSDNNTITSNKTFNNHVFAGGAGIDISESDGNVVANNTVIADGIVVRGSYNVIKNNSVLNGGGIGIGFKSGNMFLGNILSGNNAAFHMEQTQDIFVGNLIVNNNYGILIHFSNGSTFYHNVLINNTVHVPEDVYSNANIWDNGFEGNYWSNYTGVDSNCDAIGDTSHTLDSLNVDRYPLMAPISIFDMGEWNNTQQQIYVISNSTLTNFELDDVQARISFNITGDPPTLGFCRVTMPNVIVQNMWNGNYTVLVDGESPIFQRNWTDDTYTHAYFTYQHSEHEAIILPETQLLEILPLLTIATLSLIIIRKKNILRM